MYVVNISCFLGRYKSDLSSFSQKIFMFKLLR